MPPAKRPFDLVGDTVTEGLSRILASVYDGNPAPLQGLVESEQVNEYVRSAALDSFLVLENTGQMPREEVVEYFRSLFHGRLQRTPSYAWSSLVCAVADLPAPELLEEVRQAYAEGLVDTMVADLEGIERDMAAPKPWRQDRQHLITDAIAEMEWWASFHPEDSRPKKKLPNIDTRCRATAHCASARLRSPATFRARAQDWPQRPMPVRQRQEIQEVLREMINVVGSLICCQHRMSDWAREVGCVIRDSRPGP